MPRKNRIEPIREYLRVERSKIITKIDDAVKSENFIQAEQLKETRRILSVAMQLCGEEKYNPFIPPHESAMPGIMPNRGED